MKAFMRCLIMGPPTDPSLCRHRGRHILMCIIKALIYLHAYNIAHLVRPLHQ